MHPALMALWRWRVFLTLAFLILGTVALAVSFAAPESTSARVIALASVAAPLALPAAMLIHQGLRSALRALAARLAVRRARSTFRATLKTARRHPELVDLDRLRDAARALSKVFAKDGISLPEIDEASKHPYAPIRNAASSVLQATRAPEAGRNSPTLG